ncbi:hypothetical protein [Corallococcus sp. AB030]|uniref:hypothetical protein n=1 Tax=Corallococcus sp. AB030 TaxID=2316716 RepID=UPI0011E5C983|nr:hypothetical protein [Corallococcus sp. AB030]
MDPSKDAQPEAQSPASTAIAPVPAAAPQEQKSTSNEISIADVMQLVTTIAQAVMPLAATAFEARAKFMAAQPELNTLQEKNAHARAMDNQQRSWEFYRARDRMVGWLMLTWTIALLGLVAGGVFAIHKQIIDQQSAVTFGLMIAGAMGWVGTRVTSRSQTPSPPPGP